MTDLVKRLRSEIGSFKDMIAMHLEAADEIERLREENEMMHTPWDIAKGRIEKELLDDLREWSFELYGQHQKFDPVLLDAYEKDRKCG